MLNRFWGTLWLYWVLSSMAGGIVLMLSLLIFSWFHWPISSWLVLLLPGTVIGLEQRFILHRYFSIQITIVWIVGSIASSLSFISIAFASDNPGVFALYCGAFGIIAGFVQMNALQHERGRWERWMLLSGASHMLGGPLGFYVGVASPVHDLGGVLMLPATAIFTGLSLKGLELSD